MALELVDIHIVTDDLVPADLDGVVVRVYDATGATLVTSGTTGSPAAAGHVEFTLNGTAAPAPTVYQLRFYKSGVAIISPQLIEVYSPPSGSPTTTNTFEVEAHVFTLPEAIDPLLCRASGYIVRPDGRPLKGCSMHFIFSGTPQKLDARGVLGERVSIKTDATGYVEIELIRNACYLATVVSDEDTQREVYVPDEPATNIMSLLYPLVVLVDWTPPASMAVGTEVTLEPEVWTSADRLLEGTAADDLLYATDDPGIVAVLVSETSITLRAVAAGTTVLRVTRRDESVAYFPDTGVTGGETTITVS